MRDSVDDGGRPDPDQLLRAVSGRGRHRVYVGMAAGVGKTYRALHEIRERLAAGEDVLIGVLETHGRQETLLAASGLPLFPLREVAYKGVSLREMDLAGLIERKPQTVMVDELAHSNVPGSPHRKRYEDVADLLAAGVSVISTVNIQHLESLNDLVARLTGVRVKERLPDAVLHEADEILLVDVTPEALQERLRAGKIYAPEKIEQALGHFFTAANLTALREIALRQVADTVEAEVEGGGIKERVLVACSAELEAGRLIRRGGRIAARLKAELDVIYVNTGRLSRDQSQLLDSFRVITESLGGRFQVVPSRGGVGRTLVDYVRAHHVTQVVLGETSRSRWQEFLQGSIVNRVLRETMGADVYVITRR